MKVWVLLQSLAPQDIRDGILRMRANPSTPLKANIPDSMCKCKWRIHSFTTSVLRVSSACTFFVMLSLLLSSMSCLIHDAPRP